MNVYKNFNICSYLVLILHGLVSKTGLSPTVLVRNDFILIH